jgi:hypothetical protein
MNLTKNKFLNVQKIPSPIGILLILGLLVSTTMLTVYFPVYGNIALNIAFPLGVIIFCKAVFFERLKLSTLLIGRILVALTALSVIKTGQATVVLILWLLRLNILEAVLTDFKEKSYYNFAAGIVLLVATFFLGGQWNPEKNWFVTLGWPAVFYMLAYTIWNWDFVVYSFSSAISYYHIAILTTPLLGALIFWNPGFWLICRSNSLTFGGAVQVGAKKQLETYLNRPWFDKFITFVKTKPVQITMMIFTMIFSILFIILQMTEAGGFPKLWW